jgi:NADH:ubiquinone oxidoreductase subunit E
MFLQKILLRYEPKPENILPVLKEIQKENRYLELKDCQRVAEYFSVSLAQVVSLASFFNEIKLKRDSCSKKIIRICSGGPCLTQDSERVARQIELLLGVEIGNDSYPKYKLEYMSCLGLCDRGPVVMVDENIFEKVRPEDVDDIIRNYL